MKRIDQVVWKETGFMAAWVLILSAVMQAVFLVIGHWDYTVLLGNLLGAVVVILNFFGMGVTVQSAVQMEEKDAKQRIKLSSSLRLLAMFVLLVVGVWLPYFSNWTVLIPVLFPRLILMIRPFWDKKRLGEEGNSEK